MKKNLFFILIFTYVTLFCCFCNVLAYSIDSSNNPGSGASGGGTGTGNGTYWPYQKLRVVRIRVFRDQDVVVNGYYSFGDTASDCYTGVNNVTLCETSSYNYSNVAVSDGVTCTSGKNINFGCVYASNFSKTWYKDGSWSYNGTYLDNYFQDNGTYSNLKTILGQIGYDETDANNGDVVIIEPATLVICASSRYFGTSTALMKKNVSYNGSGVCSANDNTYGASYGYTFSNLFKHMSMALKTSDNTSYPGDTAYTGLGYFKYNISDMGYVEVPGSLEIIKTNSTNDILKDLGGDTTFKLYTGKSNGECTGLVDTKTVNSSGKAIFSDLTPGTYYLKESQSKNGYHTPEKGEPWYCDAVTISSGKNEITITNKTECEYQFRSDMSMKERIDLYNSIYSYYNIHYNALLDMSNTTAATACKNIPIEKKYTTACLSASNTITDSSNFSLTNVSMYNEKYGKYTFCLSKYNLINNLNTTLFSNIKSGQAIIKTDDIVSTATLNRVCYNFGDATNVVPTLNYNDYVSSDVSISGTNLLKTEVPSGTEDNKTITATYTLPIMYASNKDGRVYYGYCPTGQYCKLLGRGIISKFNLTPGTYNLGFNLALNADKFGSLDSSIDCRYTVKPELIIEDDINLEFRIISTNDPFPGVSGNIRSTGSNWCEVDALGNINCNGNATNNKVSQFIINSNNSYNNTGAGPKYKITLTPSVIKEIREYNKNHEYDDYNFTCKNDGNVCISNYLTTLRDSYGLIINNSAKRNCFESVGSC